MTNSNPNEPGFRPKNGSLWLVRLDGKQKVIAVSIASGEEFFLPGVEEPRASADVQEWLKEVEPTSCNMEPAETPEGWAPKSGSFWFVVVECRYNVVEVSENGRCFYIPGQEPCWMLDHVAEWLDEVTPVA